MTIGPYCQDEGSWRSVGVRIDYDTLEDIRSYYLRKLSVPHGDHSLEGASRRVLDCRTVESDKGPFTVKQNENRPTRSIVWFNQAIRGRVISEVS